MRLVIILITHVNKLWEFPRSRVKDLFLIRACHSSTQSCFAHSRNCTRTFLATKRSIYVQFTQCRQSG